MQEEFNITELFENTKKAINSDLTALQAKVELINELENFFAKNNLKVFKVTEDIQTETLQ